MNEFKYNIGYALSGGFIKGFAHLGIMQALHEHGIRPEILSGVSAGALAAVFYADGKEPFHIVELFEHHSFKELTTFSINKQGLLKLDSFIDFLNSNLESKTIEELKIPTIITATDLDHGRIVSFKKGKIAERLAASCCMPILFAPHTHQQYILCRWRNLDEPAGQPHSQRMRESDSTQCRSAGSR